MFMQDAVHSPSAEAKPDTRLCGIGKTFTHRTSGGTMTITARTTLNDHELTDIPVLNPGDWFGKTWLIEIGGCYWPLFLIVEADSLSDAIEELAENEKWGHHITVSPEDLKDYPEDERNYGPSGQVFDLDHLMVHGREGEDVPFPCRYFGDGLPSAGANPAEFCWDDFDAEEQA
jgi:hypothetical protein